jgi:hypothetical protein
VAVVVIAAAATIAMLQTNQSGPTLVVENQETGQIYYETNAYDGLTVTLRWIHSIEHEPWQETYHVEGNGLILDEVAIKSYGAGVDGDPGGITTIEDGVIHTRNINKRFEDLRWVHSHATKHTLRVGDHQIDTDDIEHRAFVVLKITE